MATLLIQNLLDLPEKVSRGNFVLRLTEGVARPEETLRGYVVTKRKRGGPLRTGGRTVTLGTPVNGRVATKTPRRRSQGATTQARTRRGALPITGWTDSMGRARS